MSTLLTLSTEQWALLKLKFIRKYNHLTEADLAFQPGEEQALISRLAARVSRPESYILFTLQKELVDLSTNRL